MKETRSHLTPTDVLPQLKARLQLLLLVISGSRENNLALFKEHLNVMQLTKDGFPLTVVVENSMCC